MILNTDGTTPIYMQIAEWIENQILNETFHADEKVYSQYKLAEMFNINPATAAKGLNILTEEDILYTKRGLGKFVMKDAKQRIMDKRKNETLKDLVHHAVLEANRLHISETEFIQMVVKANRELKGEER